MEQEQVSNAEMAPESDVQDKIFDAGESEDFFSALDSSVNGGIQDEQELTQLTSEEGDNTPQSPSEVQQQSDDISQEALQKRYSDSSREAKRLNGQLQELELQQPQFQQPQHQQIQGRGTSCPRPQDHVLRPLAHILR